MILIRKYFPGLSPAQEEQLSMLEELYAYWNERINVISRKDMEHFYERHVLHSLAIGLCFPFRQGTRILDAGTGGGFPGIPLAILFPEVEFMLADSIAKKIRVVDTVKDTLGCKNVSAICARIEKIPESYDFVISRAVTALPGFVDLVRFRIRRKGFNDFRNGILYLKGGELDEELNACRGWKSRVVHIGNYLEEDFFQTKKIVHLWPG